MTTAIPSVDAERLRTALREVIDPEAGLNIVDLGLVYGIEVAATQVRVALTMTSPACPLGDLIVGEAEAVLRPLLADDVDLAVELVWSPPWEPSMMSERARGHFQW